MRSPSFPMVHQMRNKTGFAKLHLVPHILQNKRDSYIIYCEKSLDCLGLSINFILSTRLQTIRSVLVTEMQEKKLAMQICVVFHYYRIRVTPIY